jgi:hypothetical protein
VRRASAFAFASLIAVAPRLARADRRYYGETYDSTLAAPGALDVELWSTWHQAPSAGGATLWRHQFELETGITDHWDVALYNIFTSEQGEGTRYEAAKLETRYRLSDPGQWFVDPVLYLEVRKEFIEDKPWAIEEKLILGKDIGRLNFSANVLAEQEFPEGGGNEIEWGYAFGASYELSPYLRLGGETFGFWNRGAGESTYQYTSYAGPAVSIAWSRVWLVLAASWGLNDASEKLRARAILAFQF